MLYQEMTILDELHLNPSEWGGLSRLDKKILFYYCVMKGWRTEKSMEADRKLREIETQQQQFLKELPQQKKIGR